MPMQIPSAIPHGMEYEMIQFLTQSQINSIFELYIGYF